MAHRVPERLWSLARQGAATGIGNGATDHNRQLSTQLLKHQLHGKQGRLGI